MKQLVILLVAGVVIGVVLWLAGAFDRGPAADIEPKNIHVVKEGPLKITLTERGTLKAKKSTQIRAETHGKLSWIVDEGTKVKKGDTLVKMDTEQVKQQVDQLANQITQLEAELKSAETEVTVQQGQNLTNIEKAELALQVAEVELEKLLESDIPEKERELKLAIEEAETNLDRAKDNVEASKQLLDEDFVTKNDHKDTLLKLKKAQNSLDTAKRKWQAYLKYQRPLDIKKKKAGLEEAKRGLERAKQQADAQLNAKKARVTQKQVNLSRIRISHTKEVEKLGKMELKAPTDGTVLLGDPDNPWNNQNIKVGNQVWHRMVLLTLPDSRELGVTIQVHEADIAKLKKGMKAFIRSETLKDTMFEGEIEKIDTVANAGRRWGGDSVKRFKVELSLTGDHGDLKTGTSAEVEILVDEIPDVLSVPAQAIHVEGDKYFCFVLRGSKAVKVRVKPGRSNDAFAEIKKGLKEGDRVLLSTPETFDEEETDEEDWKDEKDEKNEKDAGKRKDDAPGKGPAGEPELKVEPGKLPVSLPAPKGDEPGEDDKSEKADETKVTERTESKDKADEGTRNPSAKEQQNGEKDPVIAEDAGKKKDAAAAPSDPETKKASGGNS